MQRNTSVEVLLHYWPCKLLACKLAHRQVPRQWPLRFPLFQKLIPPFPKTRSCRNDFFHILLVHWHFTWLMTIPAPPYQKRYSFAHPKFLQFVAYITTVNSAATVLPITEPFQSRLRLATCGGVLA